MRKFPEHPEENLYFEFGNGYWFSSGLNKGSGFGSGFFQYLQNFQNFQNNGSIPTMEYNTKFLIQYW